MTAKVTVPTILLMKVQYIIQTEKYHLNASARNWTWFLNCILMHIPIDILWASVIKCHTYTHEMMHKCYILRQDELEVVEIFDDNVVLSFFVFFVVQEKKATTEETKMKSLKKIPLDMTSWQFRMKSFIIFFKQKKKKSRVLFKCKSMNLCTSLISCIFGIVLFFIITCVLYKAL